MLQPEIQTLPTLHQLPKFILELPITKLQIPCNFYEDILHFKDLSRMTEKVLLDQYFVPAGLEALNSYVYNATVSKWIDHNIKQRSFVKGNTEDYYHVGLDICIKYTIETLTDGEEKGADSGGDPSQELTEKIIWDYGDAVPYLLAYYSIESNVVFCAIYKENKKIRTLDIVLNNVPNIEKIYKSSNDACYFQPQGDVLYPKDLKEMLFVVCCVLEALLVMHNIPIMHRDIRWQNIVKYRDNDKWFLIDFEFACYSPQYLKEEGLEKNNHAPEIREGYHDILTDIWSVGFLIIDYSFKLPSEITDFGKKLMKSNPPKTIDVLTDAKELYKKFLAFLE
ncbi:19864_t:CDS:2 [Funneliformis geosporum]|uniref:18989_t:CDS:1 n=1 Tax=Funneliformis geosporum TaxID=1117311 RepID=A0A9W4T2D9_9GLOM|nr:19864_t:CDS:2 [Funneliformis geosporum]CAI2190254.1 18989_t:CDS:2 [Funneliformis geosporum]